MEVQNAEEGADVPRKDPIIRFFCEGQEINEKASNDQGYCFFGHVIHELGRLFSEEDNILILTLPKSGVQLKVGE